MKNLLFDLFPNGKKRAVTFSYDDGFDTDIRLAEILGKYKAKCTFNLNAADIGLPGRINAQCVRKFADGGHEIACHGYHHPYLEKIPRDKLIAELYEDRKALEQMAGKPIFGMAYPYGSSDGDTDAALAACGIKYSRTVAATGKFEMPRNFTAWHPTCHHIDALPYAKTFAEMTPNRHMCLYLLFIWGHSNEFESLHNWHLLDDLLQTVDETNDVWYATNGEVYDYISAVKSLRITLDGTVVYNPSARTVYASANGNATAFPPGQTVIL